jgi:hypothetical protein
MRSHSYRETALKVVKKDELASARELIRMICEMAVQAQRASSGLYACDHAAILKSLMRHH